MSTKESVSYGLGADFSLTYCLVGNEISESSEKPSPAGISYRCQLCFSLFFSHFVLNMPSGRHSDYILVTG